MTLLASYSFDESDSNIIDHSGNGYNFSISGLNATHATGHTNSGLTKNGTGMIPLPEALLEASKTDSRTVMFWSKGNGGTWYIQWFVSSIGSGSWGLLSLDNTNMYVQARNAGGLVSPRPVTAIGDTNWHHWAATYDGNTVALYKDGSLASSTTLVAPLRTDADSLSIMEWGNSDTTIDDLRIFDVSLDASQITEYMNTPVTDEPASENPYYIYNGTDWVGTIKKIYNGTSWVDVP